MSRAGLSAVAAREVRWIRSEPAVLILLLVVPVLAFALLSATFSSAVIRDLRIDVVDADRSSASQDFIQAIDAAPGVAVDRRSSDLAGAMQAVRSGAAIAAVYIPENLGRDILAGRRPQIVTFYNRQFFTPGNIAASGVQAAVASAAAEMPRARAAGGHTSGSLVVERYVLSNPALNYAEFLLRALLPTVLHVAAAIAAAVAVGSDFGRRRGFERWMAAAGGSPLTALLGKLAPYFALFVVLMALALVILHGLLGVPFRGDPVITAAAAGLFLSGYLAIGAFFVLLARNLAIGLSLIGIVCSPAFGFAGVGFPILGTSGFPKAWGALLPLRWYLRVLFDQARTALRRGCRCPRSSPSPRSRSSSGRSPGGDSTPSPRRHPPGLRPSPSRRGGPASPAPFSSSTAASSATAAPSASSSSRRSSTASSTPSPISVS